MTERATGDTLARCEALTVGRHADAILPPIDLSIERGRVLAVVGPNGAGKTTFARTLLGLLPPVAGRVLWSRDRIRLSYVPQVARLDAALPLRARELVALGLLRERGALLGWSSRTDRAACDAALERAGALALAHRPVRELSEGQKQRVLFARLLVSRPELAVLDEPTAAMDAAAQRAALTDLSALARDGAAVVVITHATAAVLEHAAHALVLDRERGLVATGPVDELRARPALRELLGAPGAADD